MKIACLQFDVRPGQIAENLSVVEEGLRSAHEQGIGLVALPEMWPTSFPGEVDEALFEGTNAALDRVRALSGELGLVVVGSALGRAAAGLPSNRLHVDDAGHLATTYDKIHLHSPTAEPSSFSPGEESPRVVDTNAGKLAGLVCYDVRFPDPARVAFRAGAELLAVVAQWPKERASHWRALALGRAVENQCFVVACNRTGTSEIGAKRVRLEFPGNSLIVSPHGEVLAEGHGESGLVVADIDVRDARRMRVRVPVIKDERLDLYTKWLER